MICNSSTIQLFFLSPHFIHCYSLLSSYPKKREASAIESEREKAIWNLAETNFVCIGYNQPSERAAKSKWNFIVKVCINLVNNKNEAPLDLEMRYLRFKTYLIYVCEKKELSWPRQVHVRCKRKQRCTHEETIPPYPFTPIVFITIPFLSSFCYYRSSIVTSFDRCMQRCIFCCSCFRRHRFFFRWYVSSCLMCTFLTLDLLFSLRLSLSSLVTEPIISISRSHRLTLSVSALSHIYFIAYRFLNRS